jgi:hypothetical protein
MTASFDHVSPDPSVRPHLELPDWLPGPVADEARNMYDRIFQKNRQGEPLSERGASVLIELLCRLASDKRMKNVWRELYRKRRAPRNEFLNPVRKVDAADEIPFDPYTELPFLHDEKNQDLACREFFRYAFSHAVKCSHLPKQTEINSLLKPYAKMATRLRQDARSLASLGFRKFAFELEAMAVDCEKNINQADLGIIQPIVKRSRGDQVLRAYIYRLSMRCRETFGKWLPGTVATTASVVFSKNITRHKVRDIMRAITQRLGGNSGDKWAAAEEPEWRAKLISKLRHPKCPTNQQTIESMAWSNYDALCEQHAEDPNFDEGKAYRQCLDEARNIVLDTTYNRLYRPD